MDTEFSHWHLDLSAFASVECFLSGHIKMRANKKSLSQVGSIRNKFTHLFYHKEKVSNDFFSMEVLNKAAEQIGYEVFRDVPEEEYQDLFEVAEDLSLEDKEE
ncbi:hypothetical protein [Liquorilactobacillus satsumensis]|uniref:hypothetical protein n=1 Tax=Liquorilactobacillus TaxID=2767888 RepID=UPI0021C38B82|nr:hypothetical protein [Liquorilactobacillus satsumensis]MCP9313840.1 hypothetical protein [Liquorilactobacillus satsumensis]MCP9360981.1 hypothetical protein [Liquorilactobacillus satsumensis]